MNIRMTTALIACLLSLPIHCYSHKQQQNNIVGACLAGAAALVTGYICYNYLTSDTHLADEIERFIDANNNNNIIGYALDIVSDKTALSKLISTHPQNNQYLNSINDALKHLDNRQEKIQKYQKKLCARKNAYSPHDSYHLRASELEKQLQKILVDTLQNESILRLASALCTSYTCTLLAHSYKKNIERIYQPLLNRLQANQFDLEQELSGTDNLKTLWLALDKTVKEINGYIVKLDCTTNEFVNIWSSFQTKTMPYVLKHACNQHLLYLKSIEREMTVFMSNVQHLQHAVGRHPRYAYDNELYMADYTAKLLAENNQLHDQIHTLNWTIQRLESEKNSLLHHITSLKYSIESLDRQVWLANNKQSQAHIIINQRN